MRVTYVLRPDGNLIRGGAELLVDRTIEELRDLGVEVDVMTPLSRDVGDLVHFYGCYDSHWSTADYCLRRGIPYVCTPIFSSFSSESKERQRAFRHRLTRRFPRLQHKLFRNAKAITTPTQREERRFCAYFGLEPRFVRVVHGVDARFAEATPEAFRALLGHDDPFVLHCGAYSPTKNQLGLIRALKGTGVRLVCAGHVHDPAYREACAKEAGPEVTLMDPIPHDGGLLPSAYAAATVFAMPSYNEAFALAAMEAVVARCRLVLGNRWEADEIYGESATYVNPDDPAAIRNATVEALSKGKFDRSVSDGFLARYSWRSATEVLVDLYREIVESKPGSGR